MSTRVIFLSLLLLILAAPGWSRHKGPSGWKGPTFVEGELIVKYRSHLTHQRHMHSLGRHGGTLVSDVGEASTLHVRLPWGRKVSDSLDEYNRDPDVEYAQPNYIYHLMSVPNTTDYAAGNLWGFHNTGQTISPSVGQFLQPTDQVDVNNNPPPLAATYYDMNMPTAWSITNNCSNIITAIIDSGMNYSHTDLSGNLWSGVGGANCPGPGGVGSGGAPTAHGGCDILNGTNNPVDQLGHGTHVAGTIGAVGNAVTMHGHTGVCWSAKLMPLRVFDAVGGGATTSIVTRAINYAVANGAKVVNMSLGGAAFDQTQYNSFLAAQSQGVLFIIAAGNDGSNNDVSPVFPCNYGTFGLTNIVCVAAVDQASQLATFSNFGQNSVTIAAPGTNIMSTWPGLVAVYPTAADDPFSTNDTFGNGWNLNAAFTTGSSGSGWGTNGAFPVVGGTIPALTEPFNMSSPPNVAFGGNANDIAWKAFSGELSNSATMTTTLNFQIFYSLSPGDALSLYIDNTGADPTPGDFGAGTLLTNFTGTNSDFAEYNKDVSAYANTNTTIGFEMVSGPSGGSGSGGLAGAAVVSLNFTQLDTAQTSEYNVIEGTSMATPHVAGLASLLFSFNKAANPNYNYTDVVNALKAGGTSLTSLGVKVSSGKAANAYNSLIYIAQPTSFSAAIQ